MKKVIFIILLIIILFLLYNTFHAKLDVVDTKTYVVMPNDTLWDIARKQIDETVNIIDYIHLMREYNEGLITNIQVGQTITVPILSKGSKGDNSFAQHIVEAYEPKLHIEYTSLGVPNINSFFKTWMSYKAVTNKSSPQYKFIHTYGWSDAEGFMRCFGERDLGITDDYYLIALGSYYGTTIGTKYRITLDTGKVFYGVLADCKSDRHTNPTNQYVSHNRNIVEFLVDRSKLNKNVKQMGSANVYMPLNGAVVKIERIDFISK